MLITLQYAYHRNKEWIKVLYENDGAINKCMIAIHAHWSKTLRGWLLPCNPASVQLLKNVLPANCTLHVSGLKASLQQKKALQIAAQPNVSIAAHQDNNINAPLINNNISAENNIAYVAIRNMLMLKG